MSGTTNVPSVYVIIRDGTKMLFVLREHTGWRDGDYALPSGHVEDDETFRTAACRETLEEVGLTVDEADLKHLAVVHRKSPGSIRVDVFFEATKWQGEARNMEPDKHAKIAWLEQDALPANIIDYIQLALDTIAAGESYAEIGWD